MDEKGIPYSQIDNDNINREKLKEMEEVIENLKIYNCKLEADIDKIKKEDLFEKTYEMSNLNIEILELSGKIKL